MGGTFNVNLTAWADYLKNTAGFRSQWIQTRSLCMIDLL
jgi:hypothetical protein